MPNNSYSSPAVTLKGKFRTKRIRFTSGGSFFCVGASEDGPPVLVSDEGLDIDFCNILSKRDLMMMINPFLFLSFEFHVEKDAT